MRPCKFGIPSGGKSSNDGYSDLRKPGERGDVHKNFLMQHFECDTRSDKGAIALIGKKP
jgi:hypothetical protein